MTNTAILTDLPTPSNILTDAQVYRLDPPLDGVEYVAASTITGEEMPLLALFGAKTQTSLFITDAESSDGDPDKFVGSTTAGFDKDVPATFATIGYTVSTN